VFFFLSFHFSGSMYYRADLFPILPQGNVYKDVDEVFYWKAAVKFFIFIIVSFVAWYGMYGKFGYLRISTRVGVLEYVSEYADMKLVLMLGDI